MPNSREFGNGQYHGSHPMILNTVFGERKAWSHGPPDMLPGDLESEILHVIDLFTGDPTRICRPNGTLASILGGNGIWYHLTPTEYARYEDQSEHSSVMGGIFPGQPLG